MINYCRPFLSGLVKSFPSNSALVELGAQIYRSCLGIFSRETVLCRFSYDHVVHAGNEFQGSLHR